MALEVTELHRRYEALKSDRSGWDAAWKDLAELFLPTRYRADSDETSYKEPKINGRLLNSCGVLSMRTLAAGMQGGMTSPVRPWFRLKLKGFDTPPGAGGWFEEVTSRMQMVLHQSNFYNAVHGLYADLGTFGTGLLIETADEEGLRFHLVRAGEYVLDINGDGEVDTFFRRIFMTARQIVDRFGEGKCPPAVLTAAENRTGTGGSRRFNVIHGVFPRKDIDHTASLGPRSMPFASVYWIADGGKPAILEEGGFRSFPAFAPRWDVSGADVYGRSPAMDVVPDVRMLQAMTKSMRLMQHKMADPPVVADMSLRQFGVDLKPGGLTFAAADAVMKNGAVVPVQQPAPAALQFAMQGIADVEKVVRDGLYSDLFRLLIDDERRNITATEIQARQQEKMVLIGPVVERLHKELLEPLIIRTWQLMEEYGAIPPLPPDLEGMELDVTFESVLAQAQKLTATSAIDQGWSFALATAQAVPEALDNVDTDAMIRDYLARAGMPENCLKDKLAVDRIRKERAAAQQQAQEMAQAQAAVDQGVAMTQAAKNMSQTPVGADGQTLMGTLLGGLGRI